MAADVITIAHHSNSASPSLQPLDRTYNDIPVCNVTPNQSHYTCEKGNKMSVVDEN